MGLHRNSQERVSEVRLLSKRSSAADVHLLRGQFVLQPLHICSVQLWTKFVVIPWTKCPNYFHGLQLPIGPGTWSDPASPSGDGRELVGFMELNFGMISSSDLFSHELLYKSNLNEVNVGN